MTKIDPLIIYSIPMETLYWTGFYSSSLVKKAFRILQILGFFERFSKQC